VQHPRHLPHLPAPPWRPPAVIIIAAATPAGLITPATAWGALGQLNTPAVRACRTNTCRQQCHTRPNA